MARMKDNEHYMNLMYATIEKSETEDNDLYGKSNTLLFDITSRLSYIGINNYKKNYKHKNITKTITKIPMKEIICDGVLYETIAYVDLTLTNLSSQGLYAKTKVQGRFYLIMENCDAVLGTIDLEGTNCFNLELENNIIFTTRETIKSYFFCYKEHPDCTIFTAKLVDPKKTYNFEKLKKIHINLGHNSQKSLERIFSTAGLLCERTRAEIAHVIAKCSICQLAPRKPNIKKIAEPRATQVNEIVCIDLKTWTKNGIVVGHILYAVDTFSRLIKGKFIKNKEAKTVVAAFIDLWIIGGGTGLGAPTRYIFSDNGLEFVNSTMLDLCMSYGIKLKTTASYTPQSNGICERQHATVDRTIKKLLQENPKMNIQDAIDKSCWLKNCEPHSIYGTTPLRIVAGVHPKIQHLDDDPNNLNLTENFDPYDDPVVGHLRKLNTARQEMRKAESLHCLKESTKARVNWKGEHPFKIGEIILFYDLVANKWCQGKITGLDSGIFIIKFGNSERRVNPRYMRPISQTLEDMVVDPNNVDLTGDLIAKTLGEHCEYREKLLKTGGAEKHTVTDNNKGSINHTQAAPQKTKTADVGVQQHGQEPRNGTLLSKKQQVSTETAKEGAKCSEQGPSNSTMFHKKQQISPETAKEGAGGTKPRTAEKLDMNVNGEPTTRYPINCPDYNWSDADYESASEEVPVKKKIPKMTTHERSRNPQKRLDKPTKSDLDESADRVHKILNGELKTGKGWHCWQNLLIERPWWEMNIKLYLDTEPDYYYVGRYKGLSVDRRRIHVFANGVKQTVVLEGNSQPFWRYTDER